MIQAIRYDNKQDDNNDILYNYVVSSTGQINWPHLEYIWQTIFNTIKPTPHSVILCSPFIDSLPFRNMALDLLIYKFQVDEVLLCSSSLLGMYSLGKTTGAMIECGDLFTRCNAIFDGFSVSCPTNPKILLGGRQITNFLSLMLRKNGYYFNTFVIG